MPYIITAWLLWVYSRYNQKVQRRNSSIGFFARMTPEVFRNGNKYNCRQAERLND